MNTIKDYVEQMFKTVPDTEETCQLKIDILANMEDKYTELKEGGTSEHEAIGIVIAEFGNIEEVLEEMGIRQEMPSEKAIDYFVPEREELQAYLELKARSGLNIGLGILTLLIGFAGLLVIMSLSDFAAASIYIGLIFLVALAVVGISLLIIVEMRLKEMLKFQSPFVLLPDDRSWVEGLRESYKRSYTFSIVLGVALCLLSLTPLFLSIIINRSYSVFIGIAGMLVLIGLGIVFFVYSGNYWNGFTVLLTNGKTFETIEEDVRRHQTYRRVNHMMENIYWPVLVLLYFVVSFWGGYWAWSWIIFVAGGLFQEVIEGFFLSNDE